MGQHTTSRNASAVRALLLAALPAAALGAAPAPGQVAAPPAAPPPAVAQIQTDLNQKQYGAAVRDANRLLALQGPAAAGFSRFQVTLLKGDALVGNHNLSAGRAAYHDALRLTRDPHEQALATWTAEIFRLAKGTAYAPHVAGANVAAGPIDLVDHDSRKLAFAALLEDELSVLGPDLRQAAGTPSLVQILPVVKRVQGLTELDQIANGSDARTSGLAGGLLDHARNLMSSALKGMWTRAGDITTAATAAVTSTNTLLINGQPVQQSTTGQNGLSAADATELRAMIDTCGKIRDAANAFAPLSAGAADKDWGAVLNDATRVAGRAGDVLNANYSTASTATTYPDDGGYTNGGSVLPTNGYNTGNGYYPTGGTGQNGTFPNNGTTTRTPSNAPSTSTPTPTPAPTTPTEPTTPTPTPTPVKPTHPAAGHGHHGGPPDLSN